MKSHNSTHLMKFDLPHMLHIRLKMSFTAPASLAQRLKRIWAKEGPRLLL